MGVPKLFSTGLEIPNEVVINVLNAANIGHDKYLMFIKGRLVEGSKSSRQWRFLKKINKHLELWLPRLCQ